MMEADNIVAEVRRLSEIMNRLMVYIEGDKYTAGLITEMQAIRADIAEMKARREQIDMQRRERRSLAWLSILVIPLASMVTAVMQISEMRHGFQIQPVLATVSVAVLQVLLISLVAATVYILIH